MRKFLPYILISIILGGLFSPLVQVGAQAAIYQGSTVGERPVAPPVTPGANPVTGAPASDEAKEIAAAKDEEIRKRAGNDSDFEACKISLNPLDWFSCFFYVIYFQIFSLLLWISAQFFNVMLSVTLDSSITSSASFIQTAWAVVRDLSNIFFILILLYVAIQTILGIGHETKKIIVHVIIMALLINFSMFFTKVVIDSSNILALVFYNKINIDTEKERKVDGSLTVREERDFAGAMFDKFNPMELLNPDSLAGDKTVKVWDSKSGKEITVNAGKISATTRMGIVFVSGIIMLLGAYAFFVAGFAFIARLAEIWFLIIFSPFAFMSWSLPKLAGFEYLGWDAWLKRLIKTAFMAPIFMFFIYLIVLIINSNPFGKIFAQKGNGFEGFIIDILSTAIPGIIIVLLLLKATKFAKTGAGKLGDFATGLAKTLGGLAIGATTGLGVMGAAKVGQALGGRAGKAIYGNETLAREAAGGSRWARGLRTIAGGKDGKGGLAGSTFDLRKGLIGAPLSAASKITGMNLGTGDKFFSIEEGGYMADLERRHKKREERNEQLKGVIKADAEKELNQEKIVYRELMANASHELGEIDKKMESAKKKAADLATQVKALEDVSDSALVTQKKAAIENAVRINDANALAVAQAMNTDDPNKVVALNEAKEKAKEQANDVISLMGKKSEIKGRKRDNGKSIKDYEDKILPELEHKVEKAVHGIEKSYIDSLEKQWFPPWRKAERQASVEKLRLGIKSGKKDEDEKHAEIGVLGHLATSLAAEWIAGGDHPPKPSTGGGEHKTGH